MKTTIFLGILVCCSSLLGAQSLGPNSGSQSSNYSIGGQQSWSNETNIVASDDVYAEIGNIPGTTGSFSEYLLVSGFNFDLPDGVTVFGVQVDIERSDPNQLTSDYSVRLVRGNIFSLEDKSTGTPFPSTDAYQSYGGSTDCWGDEISYKDIDNNDFGVAIAVQRNGNSGLTAGRIDNIRVTVYYSFVTLPVTLQSFSAVRQNEAVKVSWTTATESDIKNYTVERSLDARTYTDLRTVSSYNTPGSNYQVTDERPLPGLSYYRLKILEEDGQFKYSPVVSVFLSTASDMRISPSPWSGGSELFIANPGKEKLTVRFYNSNGESIAQAVTDTRVVPSLALAKTKGLVYYKVFDGYNRLLSTGNLMVY